MIPILERHEHRAPDPRAELVRLSPDLGRLAYAIQPEEPLPDDGGPELEPTDDEQDGGIYVAPVAGGAPERWLELEPPWRVEALDWAPTGTGFGCVLCRNELEAPERFVAWFDGPRAEQGRVPGHAFAWTPQANALVVADVRGQELRRYATVGRKVETICELHDDGHGGFPPHIAVAPTGKRIAFTCRRFSDGLSEVWVVGGRGAEAKLLTQIPGAQLHAFPFWSPRGVSLGLYIVHLQQQKTGIVLVPQLRGQGRIVYESAAIDPPMAPCWSPSTRSLVFLRATAAQACRLVAVDCRHGDEQELDGNTIAGSPRFVDDRRLAVDGGSIAHVFDLGTEL
jgi:hypothetical protein